MDKNQGIGDNLSYLKERHGEIYAAYEEFGRLVHEQGGPLDEKSRWLIKVAVTTVGQQPLALRTHIRKALNDGCTVDEIEHAILLAAPSAGFPTMMEGLMVLREEAAQQ